MAGSLHERKPSSHDVSISSIYFNLLHLEEILGVVDVYHVCIRGEDILVLGRDESSSFDHLSTIKLMINCVNTKDC